MRHGNDLLAVEKLKGFDGDIHEQGKILRQGDLVVFERYRKQKRRVFLFENTVILTKTKEQLHELEVFEFRNAYKVCSIFSSSSLPSSILLRCFL